MNRRTIAIGVAVLFAAAIACQPGYAKKKRYAGKTKAKTTQKAKTEINSTESKATDIELTEEVVVVRSQGNIAERKDTPKGEMVYSTVEQPAEFPGGVGELMKWLSMNVRYPEKSVEENAQGRVLVRFIVNTDGSISEAEILKGVTPELDAESIRVVNAMPRWQPGKLNGKVVRSYYVLPITFRLN